MLKKLRDGQMQSILMERATHQTGYWKGTQLVSMSTKVSTEQHVQELSIKVNNRESELEAQFNKNVEHDLDDGKTGRSELQKKN